LEQLYVDQDRDWVIDAVPAALAWIPGKTRQRRTQPFRFILRHRVSSRADVSQIEIDLTWSLDALRQGDPGVVEHAERMRAGRTAQREHVPELAGYALALVAISILMPGQRVVGWQRGLSPDIVLDATPDALRGVEVAARTKGGVRALDRVLGEKGPPLMERGDILEVHLSLWCASPRVSLMYGLKP
jgi:hypothetical protein